MTGPGIEVGYDIIDLLSDSEDEEEVPAGSELEVFDAHFVQQLEDEYTNLGDLFDNLGAQSANDRETIDLTAISDVDEPSSNSNLIDDDDPALDVRPSKWGDEGQILTEAACVQMVLSVLPDASVDYVFKVIQEQTTEATRTLVQCEQIITQLLDSGAYPKEVDEAKKRKRKRKRGDDDDLSEYEKEEPDPEVKGYQQDALELLKDEFLSVPVRHITNTLKEQKTLYKAYGKLEEQVRNYQRVATTFSKIGKSRPKRGIELILIERGSQLPKEMHAAKKRKEIEAVKRRKAEEAEQAEEDNLQRAQINNEMSECACCFNDVPINRMISCNGDTPHLYCVDCPRQQIETQMGQSRCRPKCFGVDDCSGTFSRAYLQQVLSEKTFERLEHMQQLEDLQEAGLDFLSECPFCDFKMECPPIELDKEFRCQNTKCGSTSCRLCQKASHIPLSCEEAKKDGQLTLRHIVEEAMSAALIRQCNQCKHPFIKEHGCNKMTCTHCRNVQCYVCSKNVRDYQHFGEAQHNKCPLHENIEDRHEQEVKRAAEEAMAKVRADHPELSEADLMIKVSDRVKQAENARKGRAAANANNLPRRMGGDELRNPDIPRPGPVAQPIVPLPPLPPQFALPIPQPVEYGQAAQYVNPYLAAAPIPIHRQPFQPVRFVQPVEHMARAQMPFNPYYLQNVAPQPCLRCFLFHPPDQYC
ncbi:hypothetical protein BKA66DRAFT_416205 [Pyrenochaeta sp. MPI-SDFR-AT-0127]|nr:hypothetical protein BKA66DRAFT_416205 [Pyrenochaeta sp. MPI-SDFR-AT-0127]